MSTGGVRRGPGALWSLSLLALLAAALWALYWASADNLLLGSGPVHGGVRIAATLLTALLVVLSGGRAVLGLGLAAGLGVEPTGLQRAIAYGLLTFAASAVVLASFGFDISAVLTTSAILTAAVGLALQPTLGSLVSGVALHMDRVLHVGDAVMLDGQRVEIIRLDWRTAVGRRKDGMLVVVPNARISNEMLMVNTAGEPSRRDTAFPAPAAVPPQRVTDLVTALLVDFPQIDVSHPAMVMVAAYEPEHAVTRYLARYWVRNLWDMPEVESEVLRRIWYAFQREGIPWPVSRLYAEEQRALGAAALAPGGQPLAEAVATLLPGPDRAVDARRLAGEGELLLYAPDERLVLPARCAGRALLIISGWAHEELGGSGVLADATAPPLLRIQRLGRAAALRKVADTLARHIGPYAEHAVRRTAAEAAGLEDLCRLVAGEIEDPRRRARFLAELEQPAEPELGPGCVMASQRDATGRWVSDPPARAAEEVALLAIRPDLAVLLRPRPFPQAAAAAG
ncbi:mechanosensitive ion channel [Roseomonas sp. M0104]|uniref:Small-conductance mechanosensitive channel n=1 Tax=Teichococcus coralli TaxID=2545983 RepID=A0A845B3K5_9PROT|nr:mechanosensitive ion channel domain-containing protein [Pseudoroseomonas coralli]MXP61781.1 mechanosensitive ion channel [Pseudoroseomonas coralli]